ncbi:ABC transporter permease [Actinoallomurus purpureus]|uniref:ABC transporter permease n=1 Tax=Actinoallomurus purpureus TaxID=478114 RepID=UPI002092AC8D|nr:ABC transporter permease [Actinoallomurus purpureus]MCO6005951.1 ABC transporter permease [Actinoallomurus purpureus]
MSEQNMTAVSAAQEAAPHDSPTAVTARRRRLRGRATILSIQAVLVVAVLGSWELAARQKWIDTFLYGQPSGVWKQLVDWFEHGTEVGSIWQQFEVTLEEALLGFLIGSVAGIVLGVALGRVRILAAIFGPFIKLFNSIPRIVLAAIFALWFGLAIPGKVATAVVLVFFVVFFNAFQGTREVDRNLIANARILGASPWKVTTQVVVPSAFTWIIASLHVAFGFALIGAVVGEIIGAQHGLGLLINQAKGNFNPNGVYAGTVLVAVMALAAEFLLTVLERRLLAWRPSNDRDPESGL